MTRKPTAMLWYPLDSLGVEWARSGRGLGQPDSPTCVVTGCYSMPFVALRTPAGSRAVCFRHYEQLNRAPAAS